LSLSSGSSAVQSSVQAVHMVSAYVVRMYSLVCSSLYVDNQALTLKHWQAAQAAKETGSGAANLQLGPAPGPPRPERPASVTYAGQELPIVRCVDGGWCVSTGGHVIY